MTKYVDSAGVRIAWDQFGSGEPLLLIMGHRWSRRMWHPIADELGRHFRVIAFDNRGSGESEAPPGRYPLSAMTEDAARVLDAAGTDRAHVFGVSMGGVIAQDLALHHPARVDRLVLGCTAALTADKMRLSRGRRWSYYLPDKVVNAAGRPLLYGTMSKSPAIRRDLAVLTGEKTKRTGLLGQALAVSDHAADIEALRALSHSTLVLHGGKDKVVPVAWGRELADLIPRATLRVFETAGHNFMPTHADETADEIVRFLATPDRAPRASSS